MDRLASLLQFHETDQADPFIQFALALEYRKQGKLEEALGWFERLVENQPDYIGTYYHLGKLQEQLAQTERAAETYRNGIAEARRQSDGHSRSELQSALMDLETGANDDDD